MKLWILYSFFLMGLLSAWPWQYVKRDTIRPVIKHEYVRQKCHLVRTWDLQNLPGGKC